MVKVLIHELYLKKTCCLDDSTRPNAWTEGLSCIAFLSIDYVVGYCNLKKEDSVIRCVS